MRVYKNLSQKEMLSFINLKEGLLAGKGKKSETDGVSSRLEMLAEVE